PHLQRALHDPLAPQHRVQQPAPRLLRQVATEPLQRRAGDAPARKSAAPRGATAAARHAGRVQLV
ncbi:hypothetical protein TSOC_014096, partial [Tetrabaena socialis]